MCIQKHFSDDGGRDIDWSRTSEDYAEHRPDYPAKFYERLAKRGIGLPNQKILDLGTGVGYLAHNFAQRAAQATGIDIAAGQLEVARRRAAAANLEIDYREATAEQTHLPANSFDVVTASQCWLYFDPQLATAEAKRLLKPTGLLAICYLCWLPQESPIAQQSEELVLKYNPAWTGAGYTGETSQELPEYFKGHFQLVDNLVISADIPFTHKSWRGRWRACRGVGATLKPDQIEKFDHDHAALLAKTVDQHFTIPHQIACQILRATT